MKKVVQTFYTTKDFGFYRAEVEVNGRTFAVVHADTLEARNWHPLSYIERELHQQLLQQIGKELGLIK